MAQPSDRDQIDLDESAAAVMRRQLPLRMPEAKLKAMSDEELRNLLGFGGNEDGTLYPAAIQAISFELYRRELARATKPHWSARPMLWVAVIGSLAGLVAAVAGVWSLLLQFQQSAPPAAQSVGPPGTALPVATPPPPQGSRSTGR